MIPSEGMLLYFCLLHVKINDKQLTTEGVASLEGFSELWSHLDQEVLVFIKLPLSCRHSVVDHILYGLSVFGIQDITYSLLVKMVPVFLIREELQQLLLLPCVIEEVFDSQSFDLRDCCYFHL